MTTTTIAFAAAAGMIIRDYDPDGDAHTEIGYITATLTAADGNIDLDAAEAALADAGWQLAGAGWRENQTGEMVIEIAPAATARLNVYDGTIEITGAPVEDSGISAVSGRLLSLQGETGPWAEDDTGFGRADALLTSMGWQRAGGDWDDQGTDFWFAPVFPARRPVFEAHSLYRVAGVGAELIASFASPLCDLAGNGIRVTGAGEDMLIPAAGLNFLASARTPDDDGYIEDGCLWAGGDPYAITAAA
jgi:hypothetical protein